MLKDETVIVELGEFQPRFDTFEMETRPVWNWCPSQAKIRVQVGSWSATLSGIGYVWVTALKLPQCKAVSDSNIEVQGPF